MIECQSAKELLTRLSTLSEHFEASSPRDWIFRGHADSRWTLKPSAFRSAERLLVSPFSRRAWDTWDNRDQVQIEAATLRQFLVEADAAGLPVPGDMDQLLQELDKPFQEHWYVRAFEEGLVEWPPRSTWPLIALAQHYGVATRFLDWTRSARVAAYFAATDCFGQSEGATAMAIWAVSTASDQARRGLLCTPGVPMPVSVVTAPYGTNPNLRMQEGVHIVRAGGRIEWRAPAERYDFVSYLDIVGAFGTTFGSPALFKFELCHTQAPALLWYLAKDGITASKLFPGYAGAARSVLESRFQIPPS